MNKINIYKAFFIKAIFLVFAFTNMQAQQSKLYQGKEGNNWCTGNFAALSFNSGVPVPFNGAVTNTLESTATISNINGELQLYAHSGTIINRNHQAMPNGDATTGFDSSSFQGGIIVPKPGDPNIYYVFGLGEMYLSSPALSYSEVDMRLDNGRGDVVLGKKNIVLNTNPGTEKITGVHHANGKDVWVITHLLDNNDFVAYLVTENGVSTTPVVSSVGKVYSLAGGWDYGAGQLKASPDGKRLAAGYNGMNLGMDMGVEVFDFDNETGIISNPFHIATDYPVYSVEFSPNGQVLYAAETIFMWLYFGEGKLNQFDLNAGDATAIKNSKVVISDYTGAPASFGSFQVAPDGRIYIANVLSQGIHVINNPNNLGLTSGYQTNAMSLGQGGNNVHGLTTLIQSYFESGLLVDGECQNQEITFSTLRIPDITSITWDFGDPDSGETNISNQPVHIYRNPGTYTVTATITSNGGVQTATTEVVIIPGPEAVMPSPELLAQCADENGNAVFNLESYSSTILNGQDTAIFSLEYYASQEDMDNNTPVTSLNDFSTQGQIVYAAVTSSETGCVTILELNLVVNPLPVVVVPDVIEQCAALNGSAVFNLNNVSAIILEGQNVEDFTVTYYTDEDHTVLIDQPESFLSAGQTIYATVTSVAGCTTSTAIQLAVTTVSLAPDDLALTGCSPYDLTLINTEIGAGLTVAFYATEQNAIAETNAITNVESYTPANNSGTVYLVIKDDSGCVNIVELKLNAAGCEMPRGISPNGDGLNDTFDLTAFNVEHLGIFNRYGREVYNQKNYTNQWHGQSNNGKDLPTGTYYYVIERTSGESKTGWIYISREVN